MFVCNLRLLESTNWVNDLFMFSEILAQYIVLSPTIGDCCCFWMNIFYQYREKSFCCPVFHNFEKVFTCDLVNPTNNPASVHTAISIVFSLTEFTNVTSTANFPVILNQNVDADIVAKVFPINDGFINRN